MNNHIKKTRVNLDGLPSLDVTVNEITKTVFTELVIGEETMFIYA